MPKQKLKSHHNGHAVTKGKGSIYQRSVMKKEEERSLRKESALLSSEAAPLTTST